MRKSLTALALFAMATTAVAQEGATNPGFDALQRIDSARVGMAYIDPEADFSTFRRVAIADPVVAFRANWLRDQNRNRSRSIRAWDMERMRDDMQALFRDVFTERLEAAGYEIVNTPDYDVLWLRPAILDLDITAPDVATAARSRNDTTSTGAATLYLQLVDSVTGDSAPMVDDQEDSAN